MFIGHFAVAFATKRIAPQVSLGVLFFSCQLADLLWPNLVLLGVESFRIDPGNTAMTPLSFDSYPYSHSLVALLVWGALFGAAYAGLSRGGVRAALIVSSLVLSHWLLDVITHRPDMPITVGDSWRIGFGLWNMPAAAISAELLLFTGGVWIYVGQTKARDRIGSIGLWGLVGFLATLYAASILGPLPPSITAVAWSAQAVWLVVIWAYWIDRHRAPVDRPARASI